MLTVETDRLSEVIIHPPDSPTPSHFSLWVFLLASQEWATRDQLLELRDFIKSEVPSSGIDWKATDELVRLKGLIY